MPSNFTVDDTSPILGYSPWGEGIGGWRTWYSESGYNSGPADNPFGTSFHVTTVNGTSLSWEFYGQAIYLYGTANCSYDIVLDGSTQNGLQNSDDGLLFNNTNIQLGSHNITITPHPGQNEAFMFDQAITTFDAADIISVDNSDSQVQYTGTWDVSQAEGVPSASQTLPFHETTSGGASVSFEFTNANAIDVHGSLNWGHYLYNVYLDGTDVQLNGSSLWLVGDTSVFFQAGLDALQHHNLTITNPTPGEKFTLSTIKVYANSSESVSVQSSTSASSGSHLSAGVQAAIAVPIIVATILVSILGFFFWRRRRRTTRPESRDQEDMTTPDPFPLTHRPSGSTGTHLDHAAESATINTASHASTPPPTQANMEQIVDRLFDRIRSHQSTPQVNSVMAEAEGHAEPPPEYPGTPQEQMPPRRQRIPPSDGKRRARRAT